MLTAVEGSVDARLQGRDQVRRISLGSDARTSTDPDKVDRAQMENVLQLNAWMERYSPTVQTN